MTKRDRREQKGKVRTQTVSLTQPGYSGKAFEGDELNPETGVGQMKQDRTCLARCKWRRLERSTNDPVDQGLKMPG